MRCAHYQPDDIQSITSLKAAQKHLGVDLDATKAIATALKERSLEMFETALKKHKNGMSLSATAGHPKRRLTNGRTQSCKPILSSEPISPCYTILSSSRTSFELSNLIRLWNYPTSLSRLDSLWRVSSPSERVVCTSFPIEQLLTPLPDVTG